MQLEKIGRVTRREIILAALVVLSLALSVGGGAYVSTATVAAIAVCLLLMPRVLTLMIFNIAHFITIMTDGCTNFRKFLVEGTRPNLKKIKEYVDRSLMLVTALFPIIGYDKASKIAHFALDNDLSLKQAALKLGFVTEDEFDRVVDPAQMVHPYVAKAS